MPILDEILKVTQTKVESPLTDGCYERLLVDCSDQEKVTSEEWDSLSEAAQDWVNAGIRALRLRRQKATAEAKDLKWDGDVEALKIEPLDELIKKRKKRKDARIKEDSIKIEDELDSSETVESEQSPPKTPSDGIEYTNKTEGETVVETPEVSEATASSGSEVSEDNSAESLVPDKTLAPKKKASRKTSKKKSSKKKSTKVQSDTPGESKEVSPKRRSRRRPASFRKGRCYSFIRYIIENVKHMDDLDAEQLVEGCSDQGIELAKSSATMMMYDTSTVLRVLHDLGMFTHPLAESFPKIESN